MRRKRVSKLRFRPPADLLYAAGVWSSPLDRRNGWINYVRCVACRRVSGCRGSPPEASELVCLSGCAGKLWTHINMSLTGHGIAMLQHTFNSPNYRRFDAGYSLGLRFRHLHTLEIKFRTRNELQYFLFHSKADAWTFRQHKNSSLLVVVCSPRLWCQFFSSLWLLVDDYTCAQCWVCH